MSAPLSPMRFAIQLKMLYLPRSIFNYSNTIFQSKRYFNTKELKKFYKNATITQADGWYEINLDKRKLRTPVGNLFTVPNEALALAVATEWNSQEDVIKKHSMHLTSMCNTAIDNPMQKSREELIRSILHFLETDTVCYRVTDPVELAVLQHNEWEPLLTWTKNRYSIELTSTTKIAAPSIPQETVDTLERHLSSYNNWALFGFKLAVEIVKSLIIALGLLDKHISVEEAVHLSRLEQEYQTSVWGNVEWYHDIDLYDTRARLAAAVLFTTWCTESSQVKNKFSQGHDNSYDIVRN